MIYCFRWKGPAHLFPEHMEAYYLRRLLVSLTQTESARMLEQPIALATGGTDADKHASDGKDSSNTTTLEQDEFDRMPNDAALQFMLGSGSSATSSLDLSRMTRMLQLMDAH